jgi:hypothetical protein
LAKHDAHNHQQDDQRINLEENCRKSWNGHLRELQQVKQRFLGTAGRFDRCGAAAEVVRKASGEP